MTMLTKSRFNSKYFLVLLTILGVVFPFLILLLVKYYCKVDIDSFGYWANCWGDKIYLDCKLDNTKYPYPSYPALGMVLSAGVITAIRSVLDISDWGSIAIIFRYFLAFFDALNFLLLFQLARLMKFRSPMVIAMLILIIPSTWVGGAVWGQLDGVSLFFCLLASLSFFQSWSFSSNKIWQNGLWLLLGVLSLSCYILTKQSAIFSLPFFSLVLLITIYKFWQNSRLKGIYWLVGGLVMMILSFIYIDTLFPVASQYHNSSYLFVWLGGGSSQGDQISGNGFNIWMFLGRNMWSSSQVPFYTFHIAGQKIELTPHEVGIFLYILFIFFILFTCLKAVYQILRRRIFADEKDKMQGYLIALLCLFHALSHLGFNVLLAGTHERYMYLGYPFLLIAAVWFASNYIVFSGQSIFMFFLAATAYGCFVFSVIGPLHELLFAFHRHEFLASIHLFLLIFLVSAWFNVSSTNKKNINSFQQN